LIEEKTRQVQTLSGPATYKVGYAYDSMERMTQVTHPSGPPIAYHYNGRGLLRRIDRYMEDIAYNAVGQTTRMLYSNGVQESYTFDDHTFYLQEMHINGPARATPYYQMNYTYDAVGNPLTMTDGVVTPGHLNFHRQFNYDALYRLRSVKGDLEEVPFSRSYHYDDAGNFHTNEEFRLEELYLAPTDGTVIEYTYDHMGERVRKRVTQSGMTSETIYVDRLYEVRDGQVTRFIFNEDVRVAEVTDGGNARFFHRDHLGNTVLITDAVGGILQELGYYPFGNIAFAVGSSVSPYKFLGNELDIETGLVYCRSRYYDPRLGRFISPDLFILLNPDKSLGLPANLNLYVYATNNPVRLVDAEGSWWKWLVGGIIIAALAAATIVVGVLTGGAGFAFGILLAASIGSALGSGIGVYSAWRGGGDLGDGFLFGTLVGGAVGAAGYALGAVVGAAGISGVWGSILAGAAEGAIIGAGSGAIIGYAGGAATWQDVLINASIGFAIGAVLGGLAGYISYSPPELAGTTERFLGTGTASAVDPVTGQTISQSYSTGLAPVGRSVGSVIEPIAQRIIAATAKPIIYVSLGSFTHVAIYHDWDDIKAWLIDTFGGDDETVIIKGPEIDF
jgi:RHS repeat-associated protein